MAHLRLWSQVIGVVVLGACAGRPDQVRDGAGATAGAAPSTSSLTITLNGTTYTLTVGDDEQEALSPADRASLSTSPDMSPPMMRMGPSDVRVLLSGGSPLSANEADPGDHFCHEQGGRRFCQGMTMLVGSSLTSLALYRKPDGDPVSMYRRPGRDAPGFPEASYQSNCYDVSWPSGGAIHLADASFLFASMSDDRPPGQGCGSGGLADDPWYGTGELFRLSADGAAVSRLGIVLKPFRSRDEYGRTWRTIGTYGPAHPMLALDRTETRIRYYSAYFRDGTSRLVVAEAPTDRYQPGQWHYYNPATRAFDIDSLAPAGDPPTIHPDDQIDSFHISFNTVLGQYLMIGLTWGITPVGERGLDVYTSEDGLRWRKHTSASKLWRVNNDFDRPACLANAEAVFFPSVFDPTKASDRLSGSANSLFYAYAPKPATIGIDCADDVSRTEWGTKRSFRRRSLTIVRNN